MTLNWVFAGFYKAFIFQVVCGGVLVHCMILCPHFVDQRLDLCKLGPNDNDTVRGQIVGE